MYPIKLVSAKSVMFCIYCENKALNIIFIREYLLFSWTLGKKYWSNNLDTDTAPEYSNPAQPLSLSSSLSLDSDLFLQHKQWNDPIAI